MLSIGSLESCSELVPVQASALGDKGVGGSC